MKKFLKYKDTTLVDFSEFVMFIYCCMQLMGTIKGEKSIIVSLSFIACPIFLKWLSGRMVYKVLTQHFKKSVNLLSILLCSLVKLGVFGFQMFLLVLVHSNWFVILIYLYYYIHFVWQGVPLYRDYRELRKEFKSKGRNNQNQNGVDLNTNEEVIVDNLGVVDIYDNQDIIDVDYRDM